MIYLDHHWQKDAWQSKVQFIYQQEMYSKLYVLLKDRSLIKAENF